MPLHGRPLVAVTGLDMANYLLEYYEKTIMQKIRK